MNMPKHISTKPIHVPTFALVVRQTVMAGWAVCFMAAMSTRFRSRRNRKRERNQSEELAGPIISRAGRRCTSDDRSAALDQNSENNPMQSSNALAIGYPPTRDPASTAVEELLRVNR